MSTNFSTWTFPTRHSFGAEEKAALMALCDQAIASGNTPGYNGSEEEAFGKEFAAMFGGGFADGVNSGTNSLYVALRALDLPAYSEVAVSAVTDPGGMMPIAALSCLPVPVDTMPGSYNIGPAELEARITPRTRAIVVAHIGGEAAPMPEIMAVAKKYNLPVIEDCSQTPWVRVNGQLVGSFGAAGAFSVMFGKLFCTGGQGGVVYTRDEDMYWRVRRAADRGKPFNRPPGSSNEMVAINCNLDEIHAAIGRVQLKKLADIVRRRQAAVAMLRERGLGELRAVAIPQAADLDCCYWFWRLRFRQENMPCSKAEFCAALAKRGLPINPEYSAALPARQDWFRLRAKRHPWCNAPDQANALLDYPTPNADAAVSSHFNLMINESFSAKDAEQAMAIFREAEKELG
jgi:perosamine synthetase